MTVDNQDKTIFRQPTGKVERTVITPTPGGRSGTPQQPTTSAPFQAPATQYRQQAPDELFQTNPEAAYFTTTRGLNPLVNAAASLIAVFEKTYQTANHSNVGGLHQRLISEIKSFEVRAKEQGIQAEIVLAARYVLCTVLDEAVLNTPWGTESAWTQRTLLSLFHNETSGGEKFFLILDRMRQSPAENLYILELLYICLSLGFEGKYRVIHRGRDRLEEIRDDLFRTIRNHRGEYERALSPSWQGLGKIRNTLANYVPMWVIASIIGAVMFLSYSGFRYWLYHSSSPVAQQLTDISKIGTVSRQSRFKSAN